VERRFDQSIQSTGFAWSKLTKAEFVPQIPALTEHDDRSVEMAAFEKIINVQHAGPVSSRDNLPPKMRRPSALHQNQSAHVPRDALLLS
jgi:hypothetical protein